MQVEINTVKKNQKGFLELEEDVRNEVTKLNRSLILITQMCEVIKRSTQYGSYTKLIPAK